MPTVLPLKPLAKAFFLLTFLCQTYTGQAQRAESPYQLRTGRELGLLGAGVATVGLSAALNTNLEPLDATTIQTFNRQEVNAFDRGATYHWSRTAGQLSDVTWAGTILSAGAVAVSPHARQDWKTVVLMYVETALLATGVERSVKNATERNRPFLYNPGAPLAEKLNKDARRSFFSGHATNAFASAVFASEVFGHYYPHSRLKPVVWAGTLGLATATCVLRYEAGKHYPTDLLAGAAFGSLVGWGIPKLHQVKNQSDLGRRLEVQPWSNGSATGVYLRLAFHSLSPLNP